MDEETSQPEREKANPTVQVHGVAGYQKGCRCPECRAANRLRGDAWRERNPEKVKAQAARAYAAYQSKTKAKASKKPGARWTTEEVALAQRDDLTLQEIALRLGRTYSSVQKMRQKLRNPAASRTTEATGEVTKHGVAGYSRGCRCDVCREEKRRYQESPEARRSAIERQRATRGMAKRHRYQWTGPDLEVAARTDLTVTEIAKMLGRSYSSVANMRHRLSVEPKIINLAGIARGTHSAHPNEESAT